MMDTNKRKASRSNDDRSNKVLKSDKKGEEPIKVYASKLDKVLDQGSSFITQALKQVQRFERQKLSRRLKESKQKNDSKTIVRIEEEIKALNNLNVEEASKRHISRVFSRVKTIRESDKLPVEWKEEKNDKWDVYTMNITARLYKAQQVKDVMDILVKAIRDELSSLEKPTAQIDLSNSDAKDVDLDQDEYTTSDSSNESPQLASKVSKVRVKSDALKTSTFLPSLTAGGYFDNSDSEASELEDEIAPRKNRRGQRARQAIAEKKYGTNANHLLKEQEKLKQKLQAKRVNQRTRDSISHKSISDDRDQGWDLKRGAVSTSESYTKHKGQANQTDQELVKDPPKERKKDDTGKLHPSWIARKQAKAKESGGLNIKPTGKKVVFD